jgi:flavin reductase (DIM6/NTAB) family NADH-FMN oxidoreductase RutF
MKTVDPKEVSVGRFHYLMLGTVAPRPIAFASTIDAAGNVNLSPYSFFNCFSANPPIMVFSPARRVRDNTHKHTLENLREVPEVVINIVNYPIVEQMSLSSTEYPKGVNEFIKAGLSEVASSRIRPPRVKESPAAFECVVKDIVELGQDGGAGHLVICEVILAHFQDEIFDAEDKIDPFKIDLVGRMGGDWYTRASGESLFEIEKPLRTLGIGVDALPESVRLSEVLTGNDLGRLGNVEQLPSPEEMEAILAHAEVMEVLQRFKLDDYSLYLHIHQLAQLWLRAGHPKQALCLLFASQKI